MISVKVGIDIRKPVKMMRDIQLNDIPKSKVSAFARAGESATAKAATNVARGANVPRWMIAGGGSPGGGKGKKKGSRLSRSRYIKKLDGIKITFRYDHLNPLGTKHKKRKSSYRKRGGSGVRIGKQFYADAYVANYGHSDAVYGSGRGSKRLKKIELGQWAVNSARNTVHRVGSQVFKKRFEYELKRKLAKRGAR